MNEKKQKSENRRSPIKSYQDLEVYQQAYRLAMEIFGITKHYPKEERFALTNQLLGSSRSVAANVAEGYSKRRYPNVFKTHLNDALGSCDETKVWLDFSKDCRYLDPSVHGRLIQEYSVLGAKLYRLLNNWKHYVS
jgi:four helix bundle protein